VGRLGNQQHPSCLRPYHSGSPAASLSACLPSTRRRFDHAASGPFLRFDNWRRTNLGGQGRTTPLASVHPIRRSDRGFRPPEPSQADALFLFLNRRFTACGSNGSPRTPAADRCAPTFARPRRLYSARLGSESIGPQDRVPFAARFVNLVRQRSIVLRGFLEPGAVLRQLLALFSQSDAFCLSRLASPRVFRITIAPAFLDPTFRQESLDDSRNPKFRAAVDCVGQAQRVRGRASVWASVSNGYDASLAGYPHRPHSPYQTRWRVLRARKRRIAEINQTFVRPSVSDSGPRPMLQALTAEPTSN
jgi:hypothetical protein